MLKGVVNGDSKANKHCVWHPAWTECIKLTSAFNIRLLSTGEERKQTGQPGKFYTRSLVIRTLGGEGYVNLEILPDDVLRAWLHPGPSGSLIHYYRCTDSQIL